MPRSSAANVTKTIGKLLEMMDEEQLVLPEIQRDFVWPRKSIKLLVDSLYRGLPIGHMLVWKATKAVERKAFDRSRLKRGANIEDFYGYLLDGQQRLTALAHLRDADDAYPLIAYLWPDRFKDGDDTLYWRWKNYSDDPWYVPIADVLSERFSLTERMNAIKADEEFKPEHEETILRDLTTLHGILDYPVGITEFETDSYETAAELFIRFNSTGRKLRRSDLSIAELAIHVPGLASKEVRRTQNRWKAFRFTMPFLVQCLLAVHTGRFQLKGSSAWKDASPSDIKKSWHDTERAIDKLVAFLTGTVRWTAESLVPSFNALIPLVVILAQGNSWSAEEKRLARRWLLLASIHGYFSGAVETRLDRVLKAIGPNPTMGKLWTKTRHALRRLRPNDFVTGRLSGPVMSLLLSMIRDSDARDWGDNGPLDGTVAGHGATLHVHHFFPRALLRKQKGLRYADINTLGNYAILSEKTNLDVSTEEPGTYLLRLQVPDAQLSKQCVPLDRELWRVTRYQDFLTARRKLLADQANKFLGV